MVRVDGESKVDVGMPERRRHRRRRARRRRAPGGPSDGVEIRPGHHDGRLGQQRGVRGLHDRRYGAPNRGGPLGGSTFAAELEGDLAWKAPKESTVQGCTCKGEWTYSPWEMTTKVCYGRRCSHPTSKTNSML